MTWIDFARQTAADHGHTITDREADWLLWEHTPFPLDTDLDRLAAHIRTALDTPDWQPDP